MVLPLFVPLAYHPVSAPQSHHLQGVLILFFPHANLTFLFQLLFNCTSILLPPLTETHFSRLLCLLLFPTPGFLSVLVVWGHSVYGMAPSSHLYSRDKSLWLNRMSDDACWAPPHHHEFSGPERMLRFTPRAQASADLWLFRKCLFSHSARHKALIIYDIWAMTIQLKNLQGLSNHNVLHIFINCFLTCKAFCSNPLETLMPICYLVTRSLLKDTQSPL